VDRAADGIAVLKSYLNYITTVSYVGDNNMA
jgi:hypothetical protein